MKNTVREIAEVFRYFEEICEIPHGSENMDAIADYCLRFAQENGLRALIDGAKNVVIYKSGTAGYENAEPIIIQGHLDMVCQKREDIAFDFEKDGIKTYKDGDFIKAEGTTLGADNGIAVAMIICPNRFIYEIFPGLRFFQDYTGCGVKFHRCNFNCKPI